MDELMFYGTDNETVEELFNGKFSEAQAISNFVQNGEGSLSWNSWNYETLYCVSTPLFRENIMLM